ncbi:MAG: hypothetical protein FWH10_07475 [Oscillospiraceae bacterium]|nr:hypothetical protein [Oscillospiraceae bacterium]
MNEIIKDMVKSGKIPGAFIFEGESAVYSLARNLAKTIVCGNIKYKEENGEACGVCVSCVKAARGVHPDIITPENPGEGGALSFHIDRVRDIISELYLSPNDGGAKVYIIKDMHNMTPQAQNALLKSLEEPPPFVFFIMTVSDAALILETVRSRAVKFTVGINNNTGDNILPEYDDLIRDILTAGTDKSGIYQKILSSSFVSDKSGVLNFYSRMENALRDILAAKIFVNRPDSEIDFLYFDKIKDYEVIRKFINIYSAKKIILTSKKIHKYKSDLDYNINIKLNLNSFLSGLSV